MLKLLTRFRFSFFIFAFLFFPLLAFAQAVVVDPPSQADWNAFFIAIGGMKGMGTLGIVAVVVQGLMLGIKSKLGEFAGKYQLVLVVFLTMLGGMLALKMQGMDWPSVLTHSATLSAVQVFLHQVYVQFMQKQE